MSCDSACNRTDDVIMVINDINTAGYEPSLKFCDSLLHSAILVANTELLNILLTWYLEAFSATESLPMYLLKRISDLGVTTRRHSLNALVIQVCCPLNE